MPPDAPPTPIPRPGWCDRLLAALCYIGLGPLLAPWRRVRTRLFLQHHLAQGLAVGLLFVLLGVALLAAAVGWSWVLINCRDIAKAVDNADDWVVVGVLLAWAAVALVGIVLALGGSRRRLPLVHRLTAGPRRRRVAILAHLSFYSLFLHVVGMACHAAAICRSDDGPAPVYVLYDDVDLYPRWLFQLAVYPIALTADARWGPGSTVVVPLRQPALDRALEHARVLILLCHGRDGAIVSHHICVAASTPPARGKLATLPIPDHGEDWDVVPVADHLQLVYITACDGGRNAAGWEAAFAPAEVTTFDRLSAALEHVRWLWMIAPGKVRGLPDPPLDGSRAACRRALCRCAGPDTLTWLPSVAGEAA